MSIESLIEQYKSAMSAPTLSKLKRLPLNYITDEEKSVRWNKEQVEKANKAYKEDIERIINKQSEALRLAREAYVDYIVDYFSTGNRPISRKGAERLFSYVEQYSDKDAYQFDAYIDDFYEIYNLE